LDVCHFFDLLRWFTSAEIRTIYCTHAREDDECITVTMTNGTVASILFSGHGTMDMPKERIDAICTRGGLCAEDYVQLNTYGYHDFASTYRFGGHSSPEGEFMHSFLLSDIGLEGWRAIRRRTWELREQTGCEDNAADPYHHEKSEYVKNNIPNFMRDQGWLAALRSFVVALRDGSPSDHAGPEDALQTVRASAAADESRKRGTAVPCA
jgi:predicted dehydrogenase